MSFRKLTDRAFVVCLDPAHNPDDSIQLSDGIWEWTCPACHSRTIIAVEGLHRSVVEYNACVRVPSFPAQNKAFEALEEYGGEARYVDYKNGVF